SLSVARTTGGPYSHKGFAFVFFYDSMHFLYIPILAWVLGFLFVIGLAKKLYKILHTLSVVFFQNTGGPSLRNKEKTP
ncbi:hypothetical protein, partial [Bacillus pseudomycoides]|uniref:hypothetical protein n=1 Tax=Bacillus pseudomycoides TaxID=64104 RepID=UPI001C3EBCD8